MAIFGRISTAMVTPFDDELRVDYKKLTNLVEHLITNGSDSIVVSGTTGESPTLSTEEKLDLFRHVVKISNKRVPIIAGTGSNNTAESIDLTKLAAETGVDGIMLVTPYYNKPNQEGLFEHFKCIAETVDLPVMVYNVPGRTSTNLAPSTVIRLSKVPNIVAVKEASGDLGAMTEIVAGTTDDFFLYSGDDGLAIPALAVGAVGVVSVASHVIGNEMQEMVQAFCNKDIEKAAKLHQQLLPIMKGMFIAPNPSPVKAALNLIGVDVGGVRLPLLPLTESETEIVKSLL